MSQSKFMTLDELKAACNADSIVVSLAAGASGGLVAQVGAVVVSVSRDIDKTKPMSFIYKDDISDGCIINVKPRVLKLEVGTQPLFTL